MSCVSFVGDKIELNSLEETENPEQRALSCKTSSTSSTSSSPSALEWLRRFARWFCGLTTDNAAAQLEQKSLQRVTSLRQNPCARIAQNVCLVILVSVTVFLYILFSLSNGPLTGDFEPLNRSAVTGMPWMRPALGEPEL